MQKDDLKTIHSSLQVLQETFGETPPDIYLILGSGLQSFTDYVTVEKSLSYEHIPGFIAPTVLGHQGQLVLAKTENKRILIQCGRNHLYEGHSAKEITFPLRVMGQWGIPHLFVTNAAGSLSKDIHPGELLLIDNHINFQGLNPLVGENLEELGPRFPVMTHPYDLGLIKLAQDTATEKNISIHKGVYVGVLGPNFETAAEIRMLQKWGGHSVAMSTIPEVIVANHQKMKVLGFSMISNYGAGITDEEIDHSKVLELGRQSSQNLSELLLGITAKLS